MSYFLLILGTSLTVSSQNWVAGWVGLEMNFLGAIILLTVKKDQKSSESSLKYFLIQVLSSIVLMLMLLVSSQSMCSVALLFKLASAPFHLWLIPVLKNISWSNIFILLIWQKLGPMWMLFNTKISSMASNLVTVMNVVIGAISGLSQTSMKKILGYSSIHHFGWLIFIMKISKPLLMTYLMVYSILLVMVLHSLSSLQVSNLSVVSSLSKNMKLILALSFVSLGGVPPFLGFTLKLLVIYQVEMISTSFVLMVMLSLMNLFFYMQFFTSSFSFMEESLTYKKTPKSLVIFFLMSSLATLFTCY